jgi:O-6-methylguanine DNA methyltransferase
VQEVVALATSVAAPWGAVTIASTAEGLVALEVMAERDGFIERVARRVGGPVEWLPSEAVPPAPGAGHVPTVGSRARPAIATRLRDAEAAVRLWLGGDFHAFDDVPLDLRALNAWDRLVLDAVRSIPPAATASYGQVARMIGKAGAARAVGGAVGRNPIGLAIPCHRVIAGDGSIGGYGGGWWGERERLLAIKRDLLAREGVALKDAPGDDTAEGLPAALRRR